MKLYLILIKALVKGAPEISHMVTIPDSDLELVKKAYHVTLFDFEDIDVSKEITGSEKIPGGDVSKEITGSEKIPGGDE